MNEPSICLIPKLVGHNWFTVCSVLSSLIHYILQTQYDNIKCTWFMNRSQWCVCQLDRDSQSCSQGFIQCSVWHDSGGGESQRASSSSSSCSCRLLQWQHFVTWHRGLDLIVPCHVVLSFWNQNGWLMQIQGECGFQLKKRPESTRTGKNSPQSSQKPVKSMAQPEKLCLKKRNFVLIVIHTQMVK